jgi:thiosulfate reductase / polysulfide reductase chain A
VKDAKARGARLVVIDPVRTQPARMADLWLAPRLGTDAALGLAMMQVIIEEGLHDAAFIAAHCTGYEALAAHVRDWTPARAAAVSGVPAEDIRAAARLYADGPSCFISGHGIDAFSHGVQTYRAFHCLLAITGNLDRVGGNRVVRKPDGFRSYLDLLHDPAHRLPPDREALTIGSDRFPLWSGPDAWQKACHNPSVIDAIMTGRPYPVRGLYASGVNIAVTYPDSARTIEALKRLDTFVVAAQQMNPTAELADLVLPKTTGLEEEEIAIHPTGRCLTYTAPVMPPRGEAKPDVEIAAGILAALRARGVPLHDVFPWTTQRQFLDDLTVPAGLDLDALRRDGYLMIDHLYEQPGPGRRRTPSGKVELYSSVLEASGYHPLPAPPPDDLPREDAAFPLLLVTGMRERTYHHSRLREQSWARKVAPDPWCKLHPETAARMGIGAGDWLRVETAVGACRLRAELSDQVPANAVTTGMGWWLPEDTRPGKGVLDVNVNAALSYQGPYDPVSGSSNVRGVPCRLTVIAAAAE